MNCNLNKPKVKRNARSQKVHEVIETNDKFEMTGDEQKESQQSLKLIYNEL